MDSGLALPPPRNDERRYSRDAIASELFNFIAPLQAEGAGNAGCALHPRSRVRCLRIKKGAHEHTGSAETLRHPPRNGFTAYIVLSPVSGLVVTVAGGIAPIDLTPASRRQNHTTSPYASAFSSGAK